MNPGTLQRIEQLKAAKDVAILAHYYTPSEVQDVADYVGDSFYLAKIAREVDARMVVMCGVLFMGESVKLLNPSKRVFMPDLQADCPMAHMVAPWQVERVRQDVDDLAVVCYVNSTARLKQVSDVCVTSANAVRVVAALPQRNVLFIPDCNLGRHVAAQLPGKNFLFLEGCCPVHDRMRAADVEELVRAHPQAPVLAHPECRPGVLALASYVGSTAGILDFARTSAAPELIVCTEEGLAHRLKHENPGKVFYFPRPRPRCEGMKRNTLEGLLACLEHETGEVVLDGADLPRALAPLDAMLELSAQ